MAKNSYKDSKLLFAITGSLLVLIISLFIFFSPPQCPEYYTQQQIGASGCVVGASIGGPFAAIFTILPFVPFAILLWLLVMAIMAPQKRTKTKKKAKK